ncbi:MAG: hypothetical protein ABSH41_08670, partial [Syntrophobacteraceae bacterium]
KRSATPGRVDKTKRKTGRLSEPNAPKGLHKLARGQRSATLGRVDKTIEKPEDCPNQMPGRGYIN